MNSYFYFELFFKTWTNNLISISFSFLTYKMEIILSHVVVGGLNEPIDVKMCGIYVAYMLAYGKNVVYMKCILSLCIFCF